MIDIDLIEAQKGIKSIGVIVFNSDIQKLNNSCNIDAGLSDLDLFGVSLGHPIFKEELEKVSKENEISYLIISNIDKVNEDKQNRFIGLVKDREFMGYNLPDTVIIVFTVETESDIKKVSKELYYFCEVNI